jgi:hypothetical protein
MSELSPTKFVPYEGKIFDSTHMQNLFAYFKEKTIKKTQLNQLNNMKKFFPKDSIIDEKKDRLNNELAADEQHIKEEIGKLLENDLLKDELRMLPQRSLQLMDIQRQLAEELAEEKISEEEVVGLQTKINNEIDGLCSEPVRSLYKQDFQNICAAGISASVISYIRNLSQLDEEIRREAEDKIADYYMQTAEQRIARNSSKASKTASLALTEKSTLNKDICGYGVEFNESLMPLHTAETADKVYELVLNGADPIQESKDLGMTPLAQKFAVRYEIEQTLNGVNISAIGVQAELKKHPAKELKAKLKNATKELNAEAKALNLELDNNEELIQAHIRAIVLRNSAADAAQYPDISGSEKYQKIWNDCKQEVEKMQQTKLTENCMVHDFLTAPLENLPGLSKKELKSTVVQFSQFKPLLQMQIDMVDNYRSVQGPSQATERVDKLPQEVYVSRLAKSTFFGAVSIAPESESEKQPVTFGTSRLKRSTLFSRHNEVEIDPASKQKRAPAIISY